VPGIQIRALDFGFLSDFGIRVSDFKISNSGSIFLQTNGALLPILSKAAGRPITWGKIADNLES
jgi:hypothetical protein